MEGDAKNCFDALNDTHWEIGFSHSRYCNLLLDISLNIFSNGLGGRGILAGDVWVQCSMVLDLLGLWYMSIF